MQLATTGARREGKLSLYQAQTFVCAEFLNINKQLTDFDRDNLRTLVSRKSIEIPTLSEHFTREELLLVNSTIASYNKMVKIGLVKKLADLYVPSTTGIVFIVKLRRR